MMARHWKERYDPARHRDHITGRRHDDDPLVVRWVYFVAVCGFAFEFHSLDQIDLCLGHYRRKVRPSTREAFSLGWGGSVDEARGNMFAYWWEDRLPQYLLEEPKRRKVVKALERARAGFARRRGA